VGAGGLDTTNAMLRSVIDGIADPVYAKDAEGRYLLVNPAAASVAGLRPDQVLGYTDAELLPGPVAARLRAADRRVMASELPSRSREELASPEGPRVYQALKAPWRDAGGRIAGVVGVSRDVTEEERADRDRRRLLARLHDIQEEERGRIAVGLHDGPLQGLATLGFKLARARAGLAACRVSVRLEGGRLPPTVEIALFRVAQQALANVADHAGASEVELRLEQAPTGQVRLAVSDDGCGFDPARVSGGGYGFGLTVMAERVEALGGRLAVRAREEGGTTVEACIPGPPGRPA
jgi:PAS domain S-box-containing protein